jgi:hypothetical protein
LSDDHHPLPPAQGTSILPAAGAGEQAELAVALPAQGRVHHRPRIAAG